MMDFPDRTDVDASMCPECHRYWVSDLDRAVGFSWLIATGLACVALVLVIIVCARALW